MLEEGHLLLLGTTGAGKTYTLRGLIEQLRRADRRVGAIDKLGNHWGLTLSADGRSPGLDFVIFGGEGAGRVPMRPDQGGAIGELFVARNIPAIFDVSAWKAPDQQRWVADFADAVFLHNRAALHLAIDEAQSWTPQGGGGDAWLSIVRLAEQGRGRGIRLMLAAQRLSRIDKNVANQAAVVVAMRQTGLADRKAIRDLVASEDFAFDKELPGLPTGTGFVWDPLRGSVERAAFPANATFDSSRTPRHGDTPPPAIAVSSDLVAELRAALAPPKDEDVAEHEDGAPTVLTLDRVLTDPAIADLVRANAECADVITEQFEEIAALQARVTVLTGDLQFWRDCAEGRMKLILRARAALQANGDERDDRSFLFQDTQSQAKVGVETGAEAATAEPVSRPAAGRSAAATSERMDVTAGETAPTLKPRPAPVPAPGPGAPGGREYRALAGLAAIHPAGLTEAAWASRTGYSRKGGAWIERRKRYRDAGLVEQRGDRWFATGAGVAQAGAEIPDMPQPGPQLVDWWASRLGAPGRLLRILAAIAPTGLTRDGLAAEAGMSAKGGAFISHVAELKKAELVEEHRKRLHLSEALR